MPEHYQWEGERLLLSVRVQPLASRDEIVGLHGDDTLKVRITAPPVEGKANARLIRFLAKCFGVPRSRVSLLGGGSGRNKRIAIDSPAQLPPVASITPPTKAGGK
jgi:uncharacterized protein (TIGR00251 family)